MQKKNIYLLLSFCIFLIACSKKEERIPENILPKETMIAILTDIELAEAAVALKNTRGDSASQYAKGYYEYIYKIHGINKAQFRKNFSYYQQHPELLEQMYEEVLNELSKKQASVSIYY